MTDWLPAHLDVAKLGRMHSLIERVLAELRTIESDPRCLERVQSLTQRMVIEIGSAVPDELLSELRRVVGGASVDGPTADELRIVEAQLLGWLHGIARAEQLADLQDPSPSPVVTP